MPAPSWKASAGRLLVYLLIIPLAWLVLVPNSFDLLGLMSKGEIRLWPEPEPEPAAAPAPAIDGALEPVPESVRQAIEQAQHAADATPAVPAALQGLRACGGGDPVAPAVPAQAQAVLQVYCTDHGQVLSGPPLSNWTRLDVPASSGDASAFLTAAADLPASAVMPAYDAISRVVFDGNARQAYARTLLANAPRDTPGQASLLDGLRPEQVTQDSMALTFRRRQGPLQSMVLLDFPVHRGRHYIGILCAPTCDYARPLWVMRGPRIGQ